MAALHRCRPRRPRRPAEPRRPDRRRHQQWAAKCDDVRIRTEPRTSAKVAAGRSTRARVVTAVKTVSGRQVVRPLRRVASRASTWLKIVAINGKSTQSLFGRNAVFAAKWLFKSVEDDVDAEARPNAHARPPTPTPTPDHRPDATTSRTAPCASARARRSTRETTAIIDENALVTSSGKVAGGATGRPTAARPSRATTGYKITAVGGKSVSLALRRRRGLRRERAVPDGGRRPRATARASTSRTGRARSTGSRSGPRASRSRSPRRPRASATRTTSTTSNKAGAMAQGLKFGAYHFARPGERPGPRGGLVRRQRGLSSAACSSRRWTSSGPAAAARPGSPTGRRPGSSASTSASASSR